MNAQELTPLVVELRERALTLRREVDRIHVVLQELNDSMAERHEQIRLQEQRLDDNLRRLDQSAARDAGDATERKRQSQEQDRQLAELRQENAVLKQRFEEQQKRLEVWSTRAWSLVPIFIGAILSLSAGLIVALVKR